MTGQQNEVTNGQKKEPTPADFRKMAAEIHDYVDDKRVLLMPVYGGAKKWTPHMETALREEDVIFRTFIIEHHPDSEPNPELGFREILTLTLYDDRRRLDTEVEMIARYKKHGVKGIQTALNQEAEAIAGRKGCSLDEAAAEITARGPDGIKQILERRLSITSSEIRNLRQLDGASKEDLRVIRQTFKPQLALLYDDDATAGYTACGAEVWAAERVLDKRLPVEEVLLAVVDDHCRQGGVSNFSIFPGYERYIGPKELVRRMANPNAVERLDRKGGLDTMSDYQPDNLASLIGSKVKRSVRGRGESPVLVFYVERDADPQRITGATAHYLLAHNGVPVLKALPVSLRGGGIAGITGEEVTGKPVIVVDGTYNESTRTLVRDRLRALSHPGGMYVSVDPPRAKGIRAG